jgi:nucleotide-binding universal stress UspA family protein
MKKILVTTDFSKHSKAGMRFAIQLATQMDVELVFFHSFRALVPTTVFEERIKSTIQQQSDAHLKKLEKFVASLYKSVKATPGTYRCEVIEDYVGPESAISDYAHKNSFHYICISTRGAGKLQKILGTNTSTVILHSSVPVLAIPHTYRVRPLKKILYASDLENLDKEMPIVASFAKSAGVKADLAHFYYPAEIKLDQKTLTEMWQKKHPQLDRVYLERLDVDKGFVKQLDVLVQKLKPSVVVLFTHTNKTWFDKLFSTSRSEAFSFGTKVPMLVHRKS